MTRRTSSVEVVLYIQSEIDIRSKAGRVMDSLASEINAFWLNEVGPAKWYATDDQLDAEIRERFMQPWQRAKAGELDCWITRPQSALALTILLDQFPRNMFRDDKTAFSTDCKALAFAKKAIALGHDLVVDEPERQFFYLPLMHSECIVDQDRCVRLFVTRMPKTGENNLSYAKEHRDVIRKFGRFPYRNTTLGRESSGQEQEFLRANGYAA